jgi:eukaryotic-like serine/threonine-protein kinase
VSGAQTPADEPVQPVRIIGRYALYEKIASGGMASVHFGRLLGPVGFSRTVAIKRLHEHYAQDPGFVSMFLDEARLAARIRHPNVVQTLDVVALEGELFIVMEYVQGESLSRLLRTAAGLDAQIPPRIVVGVLCGALHGLHAAHEAKNERGEPLGIVHRDVSPQNILVGIDGVTRVLDFGVAKAAGRLQTTREGQIKGKLAYMAPEHVSGKVTRQTDIYAASIVLWEALTRRRLFTGEDETTLLARVMSGAIEPPSAYRPDLDPALDRVVLRGLDRDPSKRFETARQMAVELGRAVPAASQVEIGEWVESVAHGSISERTRKIAEIESVSSVVSLPAELGGRTSSPDFATAMLPADSKPSQASSISVATPVGSAARKTKRGTWLALAGGACVAGALGVFLVLRAERTSANAAPASVQSSIEPAASASVAPVATGPAPSEETSVQAAANDEGPAALSASSVPTAEPVKAVGRSTRGSPRVARTKHKAEAPIQKAPARAAAGSCDPPYTIDPADPSVKHWKLQCVGK